MLDNNISGHSQFAQGAMGTLGPRWGARNSDSKVYGLERKRRHPDTEYQDEIDALFTVGRLIRTGRITPFTYCELDCELMKRAIGVRFFDALEGCEVGRCCSAIERSIFFGGDFRVFMLKGGKKDKRHGKDVSLSQIRFVEWLLNLSSNQIETLISLKDSLKISEFEVESLRNIEWFSLMCKAGNSPENYPDMFHLWTAQRNRMDIFLTLEKRLPSISANFRSKNGCAPTVRTEVLRPLELLRFMGISTPDTVPLEPDKFYPFIELMFPHDDINSLIERHFPGAHQPWTK